MIEKVRRESVLTDRPFIDFYDRIGFAPTRQSIENEWSRFGQVRRRLYETLGLLEIVFSGSKIVEIGPGSGDNAEANLQCNPHSYTFVDGTHVVLQRLEQRFSGYQDSCELTFLLLDITRDTPPSDFDLVLCEGVIPTQIDPLRIAHRVLRLARVGGVVVLTCMDSVSIFAEVCRRYIASQVFGDPTETTTYLAELVEFFKMDLESLEGMSRRREDWALDTIINPWVGKLFSVADALEVAGSDYDLLGTSPNFLIDWRWYKDPSHLAPGESMNQLRHTYTANVRSMLDRRCVYGPQDEEAAIALRGSADRIYSMVQGHISFGRDLVRTDFKDLLIELRQVAGPLQDPTERSLASLESWATTGDLSALHDFRLMWGRGQQYVSFVRRA